MVTLHVVITFLVFFFFNDTATTEIYTLSLHDALPIWSCTITVSAPGSCRTGSRNGLASRRPINTSSSIAAERTRGGSEEHTSELQSQSNLVCRLLLVKKKKKNTKETQLRLRALRLHRT